MFLFIAIQIGLPVPGIEIFKGLKTPYSETAGAQLQSVWQQKLPSSSQPQGDPIIAQNGRIFQVIGTQLLGFDQKTGDQVYQRELGYIPESLQVDSGKIYTTSRGIT